MKQYHKPSNHSIGALNYQWAFSLIHYFSLQGVTHAVISPGSRSTPLALACEKHPDINTWVQIDERSAGFFALGLAQQKQKPVILICTSGSAVANWLPAVAEASHSYTPLLLLSADRPAELQNCGANQTIKQAHIFGSFVRDSVSLEHANETLLNNHYLKKITTQVYRKSLYHKPGPVHLNIPLREPLLPRRFTAEQLNHFINRLGQQAIESATSIIQSEPSVPPVSLNQADVLSTILNNGNGLIICGRLTHQEKKGLKPLLVALAKKLNSPILIDPLSDLRLSGAIEDPFILNYDFFLQQGLFKEHFVNKEGNNEKPLSPDWILRFGQFPISKNLMQYLQSSDSHTILISSYGDYLDPIHKADTVIQTSPDVLCRQLISAPLEAKTRDWLAHWKNADQDSETRIHGSVSQCGGLFEGHVIRTLLNSIADNSLLFSGNSMAIRDFDTFITHSLAQKKNISLHCNRGISGIDGNLSTFFGLIASNANKDINKKGIALVGDLSFYHDMNGLLIAKQLKKSGHNATIIIINNNGGGIFNYLPQNQLDDFDKLWKTEIDLDFQHSARLYDLDYYRIENLDELETKLPEAISHSGIQLVEIIIDQQTSVKCHKTN